MLLTHLADAGALDRIAGMVVGELVDCPPEAGVDLVAMLDAVVVADVPIVREVPFGHPQLDSGGPMVRALPVRR